MKQGTLSWTQPVAEQSAEKQTVQGAANAEVQSQAPFFPLFGPPTASSSREESHSRPLRTSRSKGQINYKEDLKAVLKSDAAQEAVWLQTRQADTPESSTPKRTSKSKPQRAIHPSPNDDEFLIVKQTKAAEQEQPLKPKPEPKPLSLAVKGFGKTSGDGQSHPFFAKKAKPPPPPPIQLEDDNHETPVAPRPPRPAFQSLFSSATKVPLADRYRPKPTVAAWPSAEDTHVVPPDQALLVEAFKSDLAAFRTKWARQASTFSESSHPSPSNWIQQLNASRPCNSTPCINVSGDDTPTSQYDAAHRIAAQHQLWTDVGRPRTAQQCLGNETRAAYLVDWLRRLLVAAPGSVLHDRQATKKRRQNPTVTVQRRVDRRKRRRPYDSDSQDEMADFIVDDDDDDDDDDDNDHDDGIIDETAQQGTGGWFDKFRKIGSDHDESDVDDASGLVTGRSQESSGSTPALGGRLTNCIVLTGPSGCGKTAAVYACAAELGFEVFELYPGMGKRSGKEMLGAVGDLGRNHMVSSGGSGGGATWKPLPFRPAPPPTTTTAPTAAAAVTMVARQSLILIEEADLLFEEDKGFWSAVVQLVAESKRPVVITCNDLDLVPIHDLPIQQVLTFLPPSLPSAVPHLQSLAAHTRSVLEKDVHALLQQTRKDDDDSEHDQTVDLRQAIAQLQFGCYVEPCVSLECQLDLSHFASSDPVTLKEVAKAADFVSWTDLLEPKPEIEAHGDYGVDMQSCVRQLGSAWRQLVPQPSGSQSGSSYPSSTTQEYRTALLQELPVKPASLTHSMLTRRQAQHLHCVDTTLSFVRTAQLSTSDVVLDYAPIIRIMGAVDDDLYQIHQSLHASALAHQPGSEHPVGAHTSGRSTRNSVRSYFGLPLDETGPMNGYGYVRWLPFGPNETHAVRQSALLWD